MAEGLKPWSPELQHGLFPSRKRVHRCWRPQQPRKMLSSQPAPALPERLMSQVNLKIPVRHGCSSYTGLSWRIPIGLRLLDASDAASCWIRDTCSLPLESMSSRCSCTSIKRFPCGSHAPGSLRPAKFGEWYGCCLQSIGNL